MLETYRGIPHLLDTWLALTGLALPLAVLAADHISRPATRLATLLLPASFGLILAATLSPTGHTLGPVGSCGIGLVTNPLQALLNVLLFVPAAGLLALAAGRPGRCLAAGVGLSVAVEAIQALLPGLGRSCQLHDLIANAVGAVAGVVLVAACRTLAHTGPAATTVRPVPEVVR